MMPSITAHLPSWNALPVIPTKTVCICALATLAILAIAGIIGGLLVSPFFPIGILAVVIIVILIAGLYFGTQTPLNPITYLDDNSMQTHAWGYTAQNERWIYCYHQDLRCVCIETRDGWMGYTLEDRNPHRLTEEEKKMITNLVMFNVIPSFT